MDYGRWTEWDGLWTEGNKNETWSSVDWKKWNETWRTKCGLKEMRWNINNEVDNVASPSLSLTTLQAGQK